MEFLLITIGLLTATVIVVAIGDRLRLPWPVLLTLLAAGTIVVPGIPDVQIPADLILPIFLPPLLWAMARRTSWSVIRQQKFVILTLSVLLVFVSVAAGAITALWLMPGLSIAGAVVLASALAPPDPVAVDAVAEPAGVPRRLIATLQTEGLFNDASSIVCFHVALTALVMKEDLHVSELVLTFVYSAVMAVIVGLVCGWCAAKLTDWMELTVARNAFSWVIPFAVYLIAEELHASGVIAIVIAAVEMHSRATVEAADRLTGHAFWETIEMLFTGVAFGLIGLNVRNAVNEAEYTLTHGIWVGIALSIVLIIVRFAWLMLLYRHNVAKGKKNSAPLRLQEVLVLTWGGMRGMVTLALVLSIPYGYVPWQQELTVIALVVLTCTMVIPGLTLPWLMTKLSLDQGPDAQGDIARERIIRRAREAANTVLHAHAEDLPANAVSGIQHWIAEETGTEDLDDMEGNEFANRAKLHQVRLRLAALRVEALAAAQDEVLAARREPGVDPAIVDEVLHDLDRMMVAARKN
ncbi:cation:proton antiporter [Corynebacterium aquilae]|uniref:Sodium:proton antiporter n=1 Tax=Corynebacterium aquilae DSM 44791 TaxID=1431546 RepID=A0A1L7CIM1_9CORY|nr:sodium:proton antiporter [Corynebacterium aquilae]APT85707.1 sodium:proton antiporter [Corynebacterium aquilae DSM 44791]